MMPIDGDRRRTLTNGMTASAFQKMDQGERDWYTYTAIHAVHDKLAAHVEDDFKPVKAHVDKLMGFKGKIVIGVSLALAFLCGVGALNWQTVWKYAPRLLAL